MAREMVVGLVFTPQRDLILLIRKARPEWQAGKWNGIGGHLRRSENPGDAMLREAGEEATFEPGEVQWERCLILEGKRPGAGDALEWRLHFYRGTTDEEIMRRAVAAKREASEPLEVHSTNDLDLLPLVEHVQWIVGMMRARVNFGQPITVDVY